MPDAKALDASAKAFLAKHCTVCHGGAKPKGGVALDKLTADLGDRGNRDRWLAALEQMRAGNMPPAGEPRPDAKDVAALGEWVTGRIGAAEVDQAAASRAALHRKRPTSNRVEYENTIRDLLGIDLELKDLLPPDATANGFDTSGGAHHVSQFLMESYLEAADKALNVAIANNPKPPLVKKRYTLKDELAVKISTEAAFT